MYHVLACAGGMSELSSELTESILALEGSFTYRSLLSCLDPCVSTEVQLHHKRHLHAWQARFRAFLCKAWATDLSHILTYIESRHLS